MWLETPLNDVLSSRGTTAVLRALCSLSVPLNVSQIAERAGVARGHASRLLTALAASGVLRSRDYRRVRTYEVAHPDVPLVRRLKALFAAEERRRQAVLDELFHRVPGVVSIVLFGSESRGEARPGSDTDLLIVVEKKTGALETTLQDLCRKLAREHALALSWHVADLKEIRRWERDEHPFWLNVKADGTRLRGKSLEEIVSRWTPGRLASLRHAGSGR